MSAMGGHSALTFVSWVIFLVSIWEGAETFTCPAVNETDTVAMDISFPSSVVPADSTTYKCMNFKLDLPQEDRPYHIVATKELVNNIAVTHAMVAYICDVKDGADLDNGVNNSYTCYGLPEQNCRRTFGMWSVGGDGMCFDEKAGFRVGGNNGRMYLAIMVLWNNYHQTTEQTDASGMRLYMTPNLRENDAGVLTIGQDSLAIPPRKEMYVAMGACTSKCTQDQRKIYITNAINHMRSLGRAQITEVYRNGEMIKELAVDEVYKESPPMSYTLDPEFEAKPGDEFRTVCVYSSKERNTTTYSGLGLHNEMCYSSLFYYPELDDVGACTQTGRISNCELATGVVDGCDFGKLQNQLHPDNMEHYTKLFSLCRVDFCTDECKDYLREKRKEACFHGEPWRHIKRNMVIPPTNHTLASGQYQYLLLHNSCDVEFTMERVQGETGSAGNVVPMITLLFLAVTTILFS